MASAIAQKAIEIVSPTVGDFVAQAKVRAACKLAKLDFETLDRKDLAAFAEKFGVTCEPLGASVVQQIKAKVMLL
jgi:hypothetical protein